MSTFLHPLRWSLSAAVLFGSVVACGGNFVPGDGEDGSNDEGADSGSGGYDGTGGSGAEPNDGGWATGGAGTGGAGTGGDGTGGCCLAFPVCDGTDKQIDSEADCPPGANCYSSTICCSTIWCMEEEEPSCDAVPICEEDELEVSECPAGASCIERSICGTTIVCQQKEGTCDPEDEPDRNYVADSPDTCAVIDYSCPEHTEGFANDCGCGCQQPFACPDYVDCSPGNTPDPLCSSEECPYTLRAL